MRLVFCPDSASSVFCFFHDCENKPFRARLCELHNIPVTCFFITHLMFVINRTVDRHSALGMRSGTKPDSQPAGWPTVSDYRTLILHHISGYGHCCEDYYSSLHKCVPGTSTRICKGLGKFLCPSTLTAKFRRLVFLPVSLKWLRKWCPNVFYYTTSIHSNMQIYCQFLPYNMFICSTFWGTKSNDLNMAYKVFKDVVSA